MAARSIAAHVLVHPCCCPVQPCLAVVDPARAGTGRAADAGRAPGPRRTVARGWSAGPPGLGPCAGVQPLHRKRPAAGQPAAAGHTGAGAVRRPRAVRRRDRARHRARSHPPRAGARRSGQPHAGLRGRLRRPHRQPALGAVLPPGRGRQPRRRPAHGGRRQRGLRARLRLGRCRRASCRRLDGRVPAALCQPALCRRRAALAHHGGAAPAARQLPPGGVGADPARGTQFHRPAAAAGGRAAAGRPRLPDGCAPASRCGGRTKPRRAACAATTTPWTPAWT